jgi:hypothetical protein
MRFSLWHILLVVTIAAALLALGRVHLPLAITLALWLCLLGMLWLLPPPPDDQPHPRE